MKKVKAILAAVFAIFMLLIAAGARADDVADTRYEENVKFLTAINILRGYESGELKPEGIMTRADFASICAKTLGISGSVATEDFTSVFSDVSKDYWAAGDICGMYRMGIIGASKNGLFAPEEPITTIEAVKAVVNMLGYGQYAKAKGGYPIGYLYMASQLRLNKNIVIGMDAPATNKTIIQLMVNSLDVDLMEVKEYSNSFRMELNKGVTLLSEKLHIYKGTGQVTANNNTQLGRGTSNLGKNQVEIAGEILNIGNTEANKLIGYIVTYYVSTDPSTDGTLLYADIDENKCSKVAVNADKIDSNTTLSKFKYYDDQERGVEMNISDTANIMYNGKYYGKITAVNKSVLMPKSGNVILLDTNADNTYDLIFITSFETYVVDRVNTRLKTVTDKYNGGTLNLDPIDTAHQIRILLDGKAIEIGDLNEWDVLSAAISDDRKLIDVIVTRNSISGKADAVSAEEVTVGEKQYKRGYNLAKKIEVGKTATFYLDIEGKIAAVNDVATEPRKYAYLFKLGKLSGLNNVVQIRMLKADEYEMSTIDFAEKIKFNGVMTDSTDVLDSELVYNKTNSTAVKQLIAYDLNSDGKLCSLETAKSILFKDNDALAKNNTFRKHSDKPSETLFRINSKSFNGEVFLASDVKVFLVPEDGTANAEIEENYLTYKISYFKADFEYKGVKAYDITEADVAKALVITINNPTPSVEDTASCFLVDRVVASINDAGESVDKIYGIVDKKKVSYEGIKTVLSDAKLKQGDIVRLHLAFKNRVDAVKIELEAKNGEATRFRKSSSTDMYYQHWILISGKIIRIYKNDKKIKIEYGENAETHEKLYCYYDYGYSNPFFYLYDQEAGTTSIGSASDLNEGDMIFLRNRWDSVKEIIISRYKK